MNVYAPHALDAGHATPPEVGRTLTDSSTSFVRAKNEQTEIASVRFPGKMERVSGKIINRDSKPKTKRSRDTQWYVFE